WARCRRSTTHGAPATEARRALFLPLARLLLRLLCREGVARERELAEARAIERVERAGAVLGDPLTLQQRISPPAARRGVARVAAALVGAGRSRGVGGARAVLLREGRPQLVAGVGVAR